MKQTARLISHLVAFTAVASVRTFNITILTRPFCVREKKEEINFMDVKQRFGLYCSNRARGLDTGGIR